MTCKECDRIQNEFQREPFASPAYYIRIEEANVLFVACRKHAVALINRLKDIPIVEEEK